MQIEVGFGDIYIVITLLHVRLRPLLETDEAPLSAFADI